MANNQYHDSGAKQGYPPNVDNGLNGYNQQQGAPYYGAQNNGFAPPGGQPAYQSQPQVGGQPPYGVQQNW